MLQKIKRWLIAIRAFGFATTTVSTGLGTALAFHDGYFDLRLYLFSMAPLILIHTGTNLINDFFDYLIGLDDGGSLSSSGLTRVKGGITPDQIYTVGIKCFLASIPFGLYLTLLRGPIIFILGTIGALAGFFYTARPISYKYHGLGGPSIFLFMGVIMVWGMYYIQTGIQSWYPVLVGIPVSFLITGMQHSNELRDYENDQRKGIRTAPVIMGYQNARYCYYFLISSAYISLLLVNLYRLLPFWTLLAFITLPPAISRIKTVYRAQNQDDLKGIDYKMASLNVEFGAVLVISLIISRIF